jgi:hypothetical protein
MNQLSASNISPYNPEYLKMNPEEGARAFYKLRSCALHNKNFAADILARYKDNFEEYIKENLNLSSEQFNCLSKCILEIHELMHNMYEINNIYIDLLLISKKLFANLYFLYLRDLSITGEDYFDVKDNLVNFIKNFISNIFIVSIHQHNLLKDYVYSSMSSLTSALFKTPRTNTIDNILNYMKKKNIRNREKSFYINENFNKINIQRTPGLNNLLIQIKMDDYITVQEFHNLVKSLEIVEANDPAQECKYIEEGLFFHSEMGDIVTFQDYRHFGTFKGGQCCGYGVRYYPLEKPNPIIISGDFYANKLPKFGKIQYLNEMSEKKVLREYEGKINYRGQPTGEGKITYSNGNLFYGFVNSRGKPDGHGKVVYAADGRVCEGVFNENCLPIMHS